MTDAATIVSVLGWSLVHFVWEAAAIFGVFLLARLLTPERHFRQRYMIGCIAVVALPITFGCTIAMLSNNAPTPQLLVTDTTSHRQMNPAAAAASQTLRPGFIRDEMGLIRLPSEVHPTAYQKLVTIVSPWMPVPTVLWSLGLIVSAIFQFRELIAVSNLLVTASLIEDDRRYQRLCRESGLLRKVRFLETTQLLSPATVGIFKPIIFLPMAITTDFSAAEIDAFIRHELAHIRRLDFLMNLSLICIESIFFFHPCVWMITRLVRDDQEACCDATAAPRSGGAKIYASALFKLADKMTRQSYALGASGGSILKRVRVLGLSKKGSTQGVFTAFIAVGISFVASGAVLATVVKSASDAENWHYLERTHESVYVFNALNARADNPELRDALIQALAAYRTHASVEDARIQHYVQVVDRGGDPNLVWREYQPLITLTSFPTLLKQYPSWWEFSSGGIQHLFAAQLWKAAKHSSDLSRAREYTRAALLTASMRREQSGVASLIQIVMDPQFDRLSGLRPSTVDDLRIYMSASDDALIRIVEEIANWKIQGRPGSVIDLPSIRALGGRFDEYAHANLSRTIIDYQTMYR